MEKTKIEAWLDGYDQRKNDLLAWVNDGGDVAASVAAFVPKLEAAIREIRNKAQAEAALADLAAVEAAIDGVREVAPAGTSMASPVPAAAPPQPASVSEGILGALSFMDQKFPASTPAGSSDSDRRNKTSPLPAVFDLLKGSGSAAVPSTPAPSTPVPAAPAPVPTQPAPAPTPSPVPTLAPAPAAPSLSEASATRRDPLDVFDRVLSLSNAPRSAPPPVTPSTPSPTLSAPSAPTAPAPSLAPASTPTPAVEPWNPPAWTTPSPPPSGLDVIVSAAAPLHASPAPAPAPAAIATLEPPIGRPKRKPRVHDRPSGETRRAALDGIGAGPETPFLLHAVVEIPRGGGMGYMYDDENDAFIVVDHPKAAEVPALQWVAYGFVPETVSDDGAHVDTFILSSGATGPGEMLRVRPLAYLRRADGDHKLLCVPEKHQAQSVSELDPGILAACAEWRNPTGISGGTWCDAEKTRDLIRRCLA